MRRRPFARCPRWPRAPRRRHERFFALTGLAPDARVLDLGCGRLGLRALEPALDITGVDLDERPGYPGPFVRADAAAGLPFADGEFELVYCSSVIEHVRPPDRDRSRPSCGAWGAAGSCRRRRGHFRSSHTRCCRSRTGCRRACAVLTGDSERDRDWEDDLAARDREMEALFGPARAERLGPLTKSWVCVRPVAAAGAARP